MRDALLKYFGPQERQLTIGGEPVIVRTLPDDANVAAFAEPDDHIWKFVVRCTFDAEGKPVFTDDDIAVLKAAPRITTLPLIRAVEDVNGFNAYAEIKNSEAAPSSG